MTWGTGLDKNVEKFDMGGEVVKKCSLSSDVLFERPLAEHISRFNLYSKILFLDKPCTSGQFQCKSTGRCIQNNWLCDSSEDCSDGSDERHCSKCNTDAYLGYWQISVTVFFL